MMYQRDVVSCSSEQGWVVVVVLFFPMFIVFFLCFCNCDVDVALDGGVVPFEASAAAQLLNASRSGDRHARHLVLVFR